MSTRPTATAAGTIDVGGDLTVNRSAWRNARRRKGIWGSAADRKAAKRRCAAAAEGVNFIDTADSYGPDVSEISSPKRSAVSEGARHRNEGRTGRPGPDRWESDARPAHLRNALEGSLKRLRLECIDLYQLHRPDPKVPLAHGKPRAQHIVDSRLSRIRLGPTRGPPMISQQKRPIATGRLISPRGRPGA